MSCGCQECCTPTRECPDEIDPMGGATIPPGYAAVPVFVDDRVEWETDPAIPPTLFPALLTNQNGGGILIDEGLFLAIE